MEKAKFLGRKISAQAMVEFAIALPILLLLLYGILEAGRFVFIYSSVVTASRQAVRYGSATGIGTGTTPRYQDCAGIRQAAQRADYLNAFDDEDINIQYDSGPDDVDGPTDICFGSPLPATWPWDPSAGNTTRLKVTINGDFNPIVPGIVPFFRRSVDTGNPVRAESARTILVSVAIVVTDPPRTWIPPTPTATITRTPTATSTFTETPTETPTPLYTDTPSETPTASLTPTITDTATSSLTPTDTVTPTHTLTPIPPGLCTDITGGTMTTSGNQLIMTIPNPNPWPLTTGDGIVTWNYDKGHQTGGDKTLNLIKIDLAGTTVWNSGPTINKYTQQFNIPTYIPAATTVTIVLTFDKSYDNLDKTESVLINLTTPGCEGKFIKSPKPLP